MYVLNRIFLRALLAHKVYIADKKRLETNKANGKTSDSEEEVDRGKKKAPPKKASGKNGKAPVKGRR